LRSIGTALGTAIFTMVINSHYVGKINELVDADPAGLITDKATEFVQPMIGYLVAGMPQISNQVLDAFIDSVDFGFIAGGAIILCAAIAGLFIKSKTTMQLAAERLESLESPDKAESGTSVSEEKQN